ncbi:sigma-70 family RNA polymerase sigma factor [Clostridium sp. DSM 100503]|uniref:sigma-70 family RNA polymerase sigma factor n=1 Tax=Clostridium sp. DSM 100503 TaxID=2963282 RepID=UPI00214A1FD4|nr:sigma-70 family RNA polymerase sigma factor [Clostridium sp. DSM 100503]MCR1950518.1 sigma-70 family RNA polymerase sigma factor [Clostridium sp. DSM 100503]
MDDDKIVYFIKKRNEKGLELLIDAYSGLITSIIKKHLYNLYDKHEECIDDVLLSIWNNIDSFDNSKNTLKNWIAAISQYRAIDYKRKYIKLLNKEIDINQIENQAFIDNSVTEDELRSDIEELLRCLKQEDRDIFIKRYIEEKSMEELVLETGIKEEIIYNRLSRGRKKLRKKYRNLTAE